LAIRKVFVIGAGQMGNGIAQVTAQAGYEVIMSDIKEEFVKKGMDTINGSLARLVKKGTMTEADKATIMGRIKTTTDNKDAKDARDTGTKEEHFQSTR
jgi:3-hydroxybutyryl-CoA dehydrogenase